MELVLHDMPKSISTTLANICRKKKDIKTIKYNRNSASVSVYIMKPSLFPDELQQLCSNPYFISVHISKTIKVIALEFMVF